MPIILFLGANPSDNDRLAIEDEVELIQRAIDRSRFRANIRVQNWYAMTDSFHDVIKRHRPEILHFSGHGMQDKGEMVFVNQHGVSTPIPREAVTTAIRVLGSGLKCIFLNSCDSLFQAEVLQDYVDCIIATTDQIYDEDAKLFAESFYKEIGDGKSFADAFSLAKARLAERGIQNWQSLCKLISRTPADRLFLVGTRQTMLLDYLDYQERTFASDIQDKLSGGNANEKTAFVSERNGLKLDVDKGWDLTDEEIIKAYGTKGTDSAEALIEGFLHDSFGSKFLYIGATFGMGKSLLTKEIARKYIKIYKEDWKNYFPILVEVKDGINSVYNDYTLFNLVDIIVGENAEQKILIILDGLEEFAQDGRNGGAGTPKDLIDKIADRFGDNTNIKIIITTRLNTTYPEELGIKKKQYVRLLPFSRAQVDRYFEQRGVNFTSSYLIETLGLKEHEVTNPLLAWMISSKFANMRAALEKLAKHKDISENLYKSIIYFYFIHFTTKGRSLANDSEEQRNGSEIQDIDYYILEKRLLRRVAALRQLFGEQLMLDDLVRLCKTSAGSPLGILPANMNDQAAYRMLESFCHLRKHGNRIQVDFHHETFREYLLAESYLEVLLTDNKSELMNLGPPSQETLNFLSGLLEIIMSKDASLQSLVEFPRDSVQPSLFLSMDYRSSVDDAIDRVIKNAAFNTNDESLKISEFSQMLVSDRTAVGITGNTLQPKNAESGSPFRYENLWMYRWISLYVLTRLRSVKDKGGGADADKDNNTNAISPYNVWLEKKKIANLIHFTGAIIPWYLKDLPEIDLSGVSIPAANMARASMVGANLSGANLSGSNFYRANLSFCNLDNTNFGGCNMAYARFEHAAGKNVKLNGTILFDANFAKAAMTGSDFTGALLNLTNFNSANLRNSMLKYATLYGARLKKADLSGVSFDVSNMTDAVLDDAILDNNTTFERTNIEAHQVGRSQNREKMRND